MSIFFSTDTTYIKRARYLAMLWTLLIFILCFLPRRDIPEIKIPLIDKWAHMVLFGVFTYLWHCTIPAKSINYKIILLLITLFTGWLVEYIQGHYVEGRTQDNMDTLSDIIGGAIGIALYSIAYYKYNNTHKADS